MAAGRKMHLKFKNLVLSLFQDDHGVAYYTILFPKVKIR